MVQYSVETIANKLADLEVDDNQPTCFPVLLFKEIDDIYGNISSPVMEGHVRHFKEIESEAGN